MIFPSFKNSTFIQNEETINPQYAIVAMSTLAFTRPVRKGEKRGLKQFFTNYLSISDTYRHK